MISIEVKVNGTEATAITTGKITSGMVGVPVLIEYSNEWDELEKIAVFKNGDLKRKKGPVGTSTSVPWEVIRKPGILEIGIIGKNSDGSIVIPTVWCTVGKVFEGANAEIQAAPNPNNVNDPGSGEPIIIDDSVVSESKVWSSKKTSDTIRVANDSIDDIKNGYDGKIYGTAGEAVRGQVGDIEAAFDTSVTVIPGGANILNPEIQVDGSFPSSPTVGEELTGNSQTGRFRTGEHIPVAGVEKLYLYLNVESASSNVIFYYSDAEKKYMGSPSVINLATIVANKGASTATIPSGAAYMDFSIGANSGNVDFSKLCISRTQLEEFEEYVAPSEEKSKVIKPECVPHLPYVEDDVIKSVSVKSVNILDPNNQTAGGYVVAEDGTLSIGTASGRCSSKNPIPVVKGTLYLYVRVERNTYPTSQITIFHMDENGVVLTADNIKYQSIINKGYVQTSRFSSKCTHIHVTMSGTSYGYDFTQACISYEPIYEIVPYTSREQDVLKPAVLPAESLSPLYGKTIVCLGDSLTGMRRAPVDIATELARLTGANVYNCGFGGCRMSVHPTAAYNAFSMYSLVDEIVKDATDGTKWTLQKNIVAGDTNDDADPGGLEEGATTVAAHFAYSLENLVALDFSKVDIVTIAYGSNDYTGDIPLDNQDNSHDVGSFAGAIRYSVEKLLGAYPHLKIFICGQVFRFWIDSKTGEVTNTSDTRLNANGDKLTDFIEKTEEVAKEYHIPFIDNYNIGFNFFNRSRYFSATDGSHPLPEGMRMIAANMAKELF